MRADELANLVWDRVEQRERRWVIVDIEGKGKRIRSVPMPTWAKNALDQWTAAAGIRNGLLFRAIKQNGDVSDSLTAQAVYLLVRRYAEKLGISIAPDALRRTFAQHAHRGHASIDHIQISLGHEQILTNERYTHVVQNLSDQPSANP